LPLELGDNLSMNETALGAKLSALNGAL
jgi:hypothetical protein